MHSQQMFNECIARTGPSSGSGLARISSHEEKDFVAKGKIHHMPPSTYFERAV